MREYRLPSGKASIETTGGLLATKEFTVPSKASERNLALNEALEQCLHLSAQCGQAQLQRDIAHESVKQLIAERDALLAAFSKVKAEGVKVSNICHNLAYTRRDTDSILHSIDALKNAVGKFESLTGADAQQLNAELKAAAVEGAVKFCNHHMAFPVNHGETADEVIAVDDLMLYADYLRQGGTL